MSLREPVWSHQGCGWVHACPLARVWTLAVDSSTSGAQVRCSYSIVDYLSLQDPAVLSVEVLAPLTSTVPADRASAVYMAVAPATAAVADTTAAAVSVVGFLH